MVGRPSPFFNTKNMNIYRYILFTVCTVWLSSAVALEPADTGKIVIPASSPKLYTEKYRPQFHFTPTHRWIGDPCGMVKHNGRYLAYSWGAYETKDLVHWKEHNRHAIKGLPKGIATFTGSVAVDCHNSAGYGKDAYIAAFTSFDEVSKKQSQSIAFSRDSGINYQYYDLNPVIDIWSTEFRDPTVIWHQKSERWIMLVAKALEKKISFYGSKDLKSWEWLSDFGPLGDSEKSWECPDMFEMKVEDTGERKWVMVVSVNWDREQYFTGEFNGREFIADEPAQYPLYLDEGLDYYASRVFQNYDEADAPVYSIGWLNKWDYAQTAPTKYGKGIWTLPREYRLRKTDAGVRLFQYPCGNLKTLRGDKVTINRVFRSGATRLKALSEMGNTYELECSLDVKGDTAAPVGLSLCEGEGRSIRLSYDPASGYICVDRTNVTDAEIPKFERMAYYKAATPGTRKVDLQIFVDKSTVEVFVNGGEAVMSFLTFPSENQTGASLFSLAPEVKVSIKAWPLKSIW